MADRENSPLHSDSHHRTRRCPRFHLRPDPRRRRIRRVRRSSRHLRSLHSSHRHRRRARNYTNKKLCHSSKGPRHIKKLCHPERSRIANAIQRSRGTLCEPRRSRRSRSRQRRSLGLHHHRHPPDRHQRFRPIFFASIGLRTNFAANFSLGVTLALIAVACVGKILGATWGARLGGMDARSSWPSASP